MNKLFVLSFAMALFSCTGYESVPFEKMDGIERYDGTFLEYLANGDDRLNLKFDSMMLLIDNLPGFRQLIEDEEKEYTIFAVPDKCFESAFDQLNNYRKQKEKGGSICLADLLIEPFTVYDTIINIITTEVSDTVINEYFYDYRKSTEELLCRYFVEEFYDTDTLLDNEGYASTNSLKYSYTMDIECFREPASGLEGGGSKRLIFSDTKSSQSQESWNRVSTVGNDIYVANGVIHIISPSHDFGFDELINLFNNYGNEYEKKISFSHLC
jgi:hypothetical protein